jgi:Ca2+-binding RTX toxin-like protein
MANVAMTAHEQLVLELINRARLDPLGEAARHGINLNAGLPAGTLTGAAKQPLAGNGFLTDAARTHSQWMIATDIFSHTGAGGSTPHQRMQDAGYVFTGSFMSGENIAIRGTTGGINLTTMTPQLHQDLFLSPGHRVNMLNEGYRELGTGLAQGLFQFTSGLFNSVTLTENFARSGSSIFVTGVAIADANNNNFYDIGEARSGIAVTVASAGSTTTAAAGGYAVATSGGTLHVTFSGGDLSTPVVVSVAAGTNNAKVDLVNANEVLSSAHATLVSGATQLGLLGAAALNGTGNGANNVITGNKAANVLNGLGGADVLNGLAGNDRLLGGEGTNTLIGGRGRDSMTGGTERDVFDFNSVLETGKTATTRDIINGFVHLVDDIDLRTIDARTNVAGDQAFRFIGGQAFHGVSGELRFTVINPPGTSGDMTIIEGDVNGDRVADFQIQLTGIVNLSSQDFLL